MGHAWSRALGGIEQSDGEIADADVGDGGPGNVAGTTVAHVSIGDLTVGLFDASEGPRPGVPHHTVDIEWDGDADSLVKELESRGFKTDGIRQHREDSGFSVYLDDPCGNRLELARS